MKKSDISKDNLFINSFEFVMRSVLHKSKNKIRNNGRHLDGFIYITEGSCTYTFDDGLSFTVNEGDILYLAYNSAYTMDILTKNYYAIFVNFSFDSENIRKSAAYTPGNKSYVKTLFEKLYHTYIIDQNNISSCLSYVYEIYALIKQIQKENEETAPTFKFVEKAKKIIDTKYSDLSLSISSVALKVGISEVHLRKLFKIQYGVSPSNYLISVRINAAINLMQYPYNSLNDCALQSGFSSLQYFCRIFKKQMGVSPSKYKKERFL